MQHRIGRRNRDIVPRPEVDAQQKRDWASRPTPLPNPARQARGLAIPQYFSIFVCGLGRILQYQYLSIAVFWYQYFSILESKSVAVLQYCSILHFPTCTYFGHTGLDKF